MTRYLSCRTCGTYVETPQAMERRFCSEGCMQTYHVCVNCGRYFLKGEGFDDEHCSRACTVQYVLVRQYGPEPVTVVTEA